MVHIGGRGFLAGFELFVRGFGTWTEPADRLIRQVRRWVAAGRPSNTGFA